MAKNFPIYKIKDIISLIEQSDKFELEDFKLKYLTKKQKKYSAYADKNSFIQIFTKKDFEKFSEEYDVTVVGNIRKGQIRYKDYEDLDELRKHKRKKNITGKADLLISCKDGYYKSYDVREANKAYSVGYAWIGENKFLRVTSFNPLWILIPILMAIVIAVVFANCPNNNLPNLNIEDNVDVTDNNREEDNKSDLWYFEPFSETTTLTKDNKEIVLKNLDVNKDKWLCSYEIIVNDKVIHTTGAILPSNAIKYDLWSQLDAGTYNLNCRSTEYDINTQEVKGGHYNIQTTLVVEK